MSDFTRWIRDFIRPGEPHQILPGRNVHLGVQATPVGLTADQAVEMACRLLECAGLTAQDVLFADGRAPTSNERHLINLLSWREREARQVREEVAVLREQLDVFQSAPGPKTGGNTAKDPQPCEPLPAYHA